MNRIVKFSSYSIIFLIFFLGLFFTTSNYFHYKMKTELTAYYKITTKIKKLNDTYYLCTGLLITNPTNQNIESCNLVFEKIKFEIQNIKKECPYINFYINYIK